MLALSSDKGKSMDCGSVFILVGLSVWLAYHVLVLDRPGYPPVLDTLLSWRILPDAFLFLLCFPSVLYANSQEGELIPARLSCALLFVYMAGRLEQRWQDYHITQEKRDEQ